MLATGVHAHRNTLSFLALLDQSVDSFGVMPLHAEKEHIEKCIGSLHTVYIQFTYPQSPFAASGGVLNSVRLPHNTQSDAVNKCIGSLHTVYEPPVPQPPQEHIEISTGSLHTVYIRFTYPPVCIRSPRGVLNLIRPVRPPTHLPPSGELPK